MYDNKVLINLYVLSLGKNYELFLPVNEKIGNILSLLDKVMFDSIDYDRKYVIINLDFVKFKYINDTLGYNVGDRILKDFSRLLSRNQFGIIEGCRNFSDNACAL